MQKAVILIVDTEADQDGYAPLYEDPFVCYKKAATASEAITLLDDVHVVVCDPVKVKNLNPLLAEIQSRKLILIWASKFSDLDFDDLPLMARIINKPFKPIDLKYTIRGEIRKVGMDIDFTVS
jgi:hypothetical protein